MIRNSCLFSVLSFFIILGCKHDDEIISRKRGMELVFSTDTVLFDTLLTERTSITRRLRISNPNDNAIEISRIAVAGGASSAYNIVVNGKDGPEVLDEVLFGGDSLLILVEVEIDPLDAQLPYLVKDSILVNWNEREENVKLISWGQDAHFIPKGVLSDTEVWTAGKPYVIMDTLLVQAQATLTIEAGTNVLFDNGAAVFIGGQLRVNGDSGNVVTFRNTRFDINYLEAPGQWDAIYILEGSSGNRMDYALIENARIGLRVGSPDQDTIPDITVSHSIIRHMSQSGIEGYTSDIAVSNTLIYNVGSQAIFNVAGGNYSYDHCTIVNQPSFFFAEDPIVQIADNLIIGEDRIIEERLGFKMINSIVWGSSEEEMLISASMPSNWIEIRNNIIKTTEELILNYASTEENFPGFFDPFGFNYELDSTSFAIDRGFPGILDDLKGNPRDELPDIGAFEFIP